MTGGFISVYLLWVPYFRRKAERLRCIDQRRTSIRFVDLHYNAANCDVSTLLSKLRTSIPFTARWGK